MRWLLAVCLLVSVTQATLVTINRHLRRDVLATHNYYRRLVGATNMLQLEWDASLESRARSRALSCKAETREGRGYGENVYATRKYGHYRGLVAIALRRWATTGPNYTLHPFNDDCDNFCQYTQLTWAASQRVGCAINRCDNFVSASSLQRDTTLLVCLYNPKGNIKNELPYSLRGQKCSQCPGGTTCVKSLCADGFLSDQLAGTKPTFVDRPDREFRPTQRACSDHQKWVCECQSVVQESQAVSGQLTGVEKELLLQAHNSHRDRDSLTHLIWDRNLETWAKYVIRCETLYPGPRDCYTNFGKGTGGAPITLVVDEWADEQFIKEREPWCRTPGDSAKCNRNKNIMEGGVRRMACEAMRCKRRRQLTCIYK